MPLVDPDERLSSRVLASFFEVYNALRYGYLEQVYVGALSVEFVRKGIPFEREFPLAVRYHGEVVGHYRADFVIDSRIVVEIKAGRALDDSARWQTLNYLRAADLRVGLILHFGPKASFRRVVF